MRENGISLFMWPGRLIKQGGLKKLTPLIPRDRYKTFGGRHRVGWRDENQE